ncbi:phage tail protein [Ralstonia syzygii]|uniref:phage tail protein n=1 Tax=Ralstonia syzygii TaxID=28097 RepID=UPI0018D10FD9|nr:phage tail protein [Ralstonia syzygii]
MDTQDTIKAYNYHPLTGELAGSFVPDTSPLEPSVPLLPQFSTLLMPPVAGQREVTVFRNAAWHVVPDWRGVSLFSTIDGSPVNIDEIGKIPEDIGATEAARPTAAHVWQAGQWVENAELKAALFVELKTTLCNRLDATADAVRLTVVGDPLRVVEYERAATEAQAFKAAGYAGDVPPSVQSAADATGQTAQQEAEDILAMNAAWNAVLYGLRALRLKGKEAIRNAATEDVARQAAQEATAAIRGMLTGVDAAAEAEGTTT